MAVEVAAVGSTVPKSPYGLCGHKATLEEEDCSVRSPGAV